MLTMSKIFLPTLLCASLVLSAVTGCDRADTEVLDNMPSEQHLEPSDEAKAVIEDFKAEYVTRALNQQENQLAASNAMQSADEVNNTASSTQVSPVSNTGSAIGLSQSEQENETSADSSSEESAVEGPQDDFTDTDEEAVGNNEANTAEDTETFTEEESEVEQEAREEIEAEREAKIEPLPIDELNDDDAHPLPLATIIIPPPEQLTAEELEARYYRALMDLYLPEGELLPPQSADTLLSVATLTPDVFKNTELARRLTLKSPAMARLLRQYQVWEQIEAQQSIELAELKVEQREAQEEQQQKFAELMAEFDKTIQGYDEQIAKYEDVLEQFE